MTDRTKSTGFEIKLAHVPAPDVQERISIAVSLILRAAASTDKAESKKNATARNDEPEEQNHK